MGDGKTGGARNVQRIGHVVRDAVTSAGVDRSTERNRDGQHGCTDPRCEGDGGPNPDELHNGDSIRV